jgi:hypothetical protein
LSLLSGPPLALIVIQPGVEVNAVVHASTTEMNSRNAQLLEERRADAEVLGCLLLREAAGKWARQ